MATTLRSVRVPESLWDKAIRAASANGTTVSAVLVDALLAYVELHQLDYIDQVPGQEELFD